jgi:hypothetical protein
MKTKAYLRFLKPGFKPFNPLELAKETEGNMSVFIQPQSIEVSPLDMQQVVVYAASIVGPIGQEIFLKSLANSTPPKK